MKRLLLAAGLILAGAFVGGLVGGIARATWSTAGLQPPPTEALMSTQLPAVQTPGGAAEVHWTVAKQTCLDIDCGADCTVQISTSGSPTTCTATTCQHLSAKAILTRCTDSTQDYLSVWVTAGVYVEYAVHNHPQ